MSALLTVISETKKQHNECIGWLFYPSLSVSEEISRPKGSSLFSCQHLNNLGAFDLITLYDLKKVLAFETLSNQVMKCKPRKIGKLNQIV